MWPYYLALALTSLCLWLLLISSNRTANPISNTSIELNIVAAQNSQKNASALAKSAKRKIHIPKFMLDLYEERKRDGGYPFNFSKPDIVRSVIPKNGGTLPNNNVLESFEENHLLIFDVPSSGDDETFLSAELRILTLINVAAGLNGVERVLKLSLYDDSSKNFHRLSDFHLFHKNNTWLKFNLTAPVQELLAKTSKKKLLKLVISVRLFFPVDFKPNLFKLSLLPSTEDLEHDYPILLLSYMSLKKKMGSAKRTKRNVEDDYEEDTNKLWDNDLQNKAQSKKTKRLRNTCKRKHLYVDFAEIHYDTWIVQPSGYEAYQCTGKCFYPVADHLSPTKHAIVQALLHSVAPSRAPRSCCVPSKLEPISLLYVDEKGVLTYRFGYNDMVVTECGCR